MERRNVLILFLVENITDGATGGGEGSSCMAGGQQLHG